MKEEIAGLIILLFIAGGCAELKSIITPGVAYPVLNNDDFKNVIGKKYEIISPLVIRKYEQQWGGYFLARPNSPNSDKYIADVPVGSILTVHHVSKEYSHPLRGGGSFFVYIAKFETPHVFSGGFMVDYLMERDSYGRDEKFIGMNETYLRETE